jgi:hypothetical protein
MQDNGRRPGKAKTLSISILCKVKLDDLYRTRQKELPKAVPKQKCGKSRE